jgi:hypothetical protein
MTGEDYGAVPSSLHNARSHRMLEALDEASERLQARWRAGAMRTGAASRGRITTCTLRDVPCAGPLA